MGSGTSKTKNGSAKGLGKGKNVVVADVVVPNQSEPVHITGELDQAVPAIGSGGKAQVKEIGPNKFSLQMGDKSIGTFETSGGGDAKDFSSYLANTASLTIKNIETIAEDGDNSEMNSYNQPLVIQLGDPSNSNDDEVEWEEIIQDIRDGDAASQKNNSGGTDVPDGAVELNGRKAQLKEALRNKQAKLSEQEYEQMIANHRQEVDLMNLLREKEKERAKFSLASKVAARKKRRKAKRAFKDEKDSNGASDNELENTERYRELQAKIAEQKYHMDQAKESGNQDMVAVGDESAQIMEAYQREMEKLEAQMDAERERKKDGLDRKLQARRNRREAKQREEEEQQRLRAQANGGVSSSTGGTNGSEDNDKDMSAEELQQLETELKNREAQFEKEMKEKKSSLTDEEYSRLMMAHKQELAELQNKLGWQRDRQQLSLLDKLLARRARRSNAEEEQALIAKLESQTVAMTNSEEVSKDPTLKDAFGADEIRELQLAISRKDMEFRKTLKEIKASKSQAEAQEYINRHRHEMTELQQQLDLEKARMKVKLMANLEARRKKAGDKVNESDPILSTEEIKQLQLILDQKSAYFKTRQKSGKRDLSQVDYQKFLDQHQQDMEGLKKRLDLERLRMEQNMKDKMAARRFKRPATGTSVKHRGKEPEIVILEQRIAAKEATFVAEVEAKKSQLSSDEYERLLKQHEKEMEEMRRRLDRAKDRQKIHFEDKLEARRRRRTMLENEEAERMRLMKLFESKNEQLSNEEFNRIADDIINYDETVREEMLKKKGKVSAKEHQKMMEKHLDNIAKLENMLIQKGSGTDGEMRQVETEMGHKEAVFIATMETKKAQMSKDEYERLLKQHQQEMEGLRQSLERSRERQASRLQDKLEARRRKMLVGDDGDVDDEEKTMMKLGIASRMKTDGKTNIVGGMEAVEDESDDDDDDDEEEEGHNVSDLVQMEMTMKYTSTSLWTTPTQSNDVVIVPLKDEYPVKRKKELYTDTAIFREIDAHAIKLAQTVSLVTRPSFSALVNELTDFGTTELQKVRLIFRWLTAQNCQEMDLNHVIDDTPLGVLKGLYHKKITFSTLFMRMCRFIGLQCVEIVGIARVKGYNAGQFITPKESDFHHTWNAVRIDGYWHFVDCNWGVSHIVGSMTNDPFRFEYDEHYFLADPEVIIWTHFPNDPSWQLLQSALDLDAFNQQVLLKPDFFKFGFGLMSHQMVHVNIPRGDLDIRIQCPPGFILSCRLSTVANDRDVSINGIPFDLYEFIHQISNTAMACFIRIPEAGDFYLTIYAKRQYLDGELNIESNTEICKYLVHCNAPSLDTVPLPASPADHWGPIGISAGGLVPITHTASVALSDKGGDFELRFKIIQPHNFKHSITGVVVGNRQLVSYSVQRIVKDELVFTVVPSQDGRYGLHIYVHYQGLPEPSHLCSYLLVAMNVRPNVKPVPLLPDQNQWGPTKHFSSYGLSTITNPDPFIVTRDASTEIILTTQGNIFLSHKMFYNGKDVSQMAKSRFELVTASYILQLPYTGYYHMQLMGKETQDPFIPAAHLFNYLIRRD